MTKHFCKHSIHATATETTIPHYENINTIFVSGMGEQAKKRFQELAAKVKQKVEQQKHNHSNAAFASASGTGGGTAERRGLLDIHEDDEEQEISFVNGGTHEMRSMDAGFAYGKKDD